MHDKCLTDVSKALQTKCLRFCLWCEVRANENHCLQLFVLQVEVNGVDLYDRDLDLSMTLLPLKVPKRFQDIPDVVNAYDVCLRLEKSLKLAIDKGDYVRQGGVRNKIYDMGLEFFLVAQGLD